MNFGKFQLDRNKVVVLLFALGLFVFLSVGFILVKSKQETMKKTEQLAITVRGETTPPVESKGMIESTVPAPFFTTAILTLEPITETFGLNQTKIFELKASFTNGVPTEKLDYIKTELSFSKDYLKMTDDFYIDVSKSGFDKIFRVDGSIVANESGKIIIELGAGTPGSGPGTDKPLTLARISFESKIQTPSSQEITIGTTQMVNNKANKIPVTFQNASYTVGPSTQ